MLRRWTIAVAMTAAMSWSPSVTAAQVPAMEGWVRGYDDAMMTTGATTWFWIRLLNALSVPTPAYTGGSVSDRRPSGLGIQRADSPPRLRAFSDSPTTERLSAPAPQLEIANGDVPPIVWTNAPSVSNDDPQTTQTAGGQLAGNFFARHVDASDRPSTPADHPSTGDAQETIQKTSVETLNAPPAPPTENEINDPPSIFESDGLIQPDVCRDDCGGSAPILTQAVVFGTPEPSTVGLVGMGLSVLALLHGRARLRRRSPRRDVDIDR